MCAWTKVIRLQTLPNTYWHSVGGYRRRGVIASPGGITGHTMRQNAYCGSTQANLGQNLWFHRSE